jgi:outer membrane receptor protein involved in Fe transport
MSYRRFDVGQILLIGCTLSIVAGPAGADDTPPPAVAPGTETITVTAQKRAQDVKEVPLSITTIGGEDLKQEHITDYTDLSRAVPGLAFANTGGSGLNKLELRGVSSNADEPTVGLYLDDAPITTRNLINTGAAEPKFFDIDRVEVLRGPQGTLYGASSTGGTIRFITNQPDLDNFGGTALSMLSGTEHGGINYEENGVVNIPLVDGKAALRLGADVVDDSGYINHFSTTGVLTDQGVNDERTFAFKGAFKVLPTDGLTVTASLFFQRLRSDDTSVYVLPSTQFNANPFVPNVNLPPLAEDKLVPERGRDTLFLPSVTVDYDLGWGDLTSVSSYFWREFPRQQDGTFYNSVLLAETLQSLSAQFPNVDPTPISRLPSPAYITPEINTYSQEIRIASKSEKESGLPYSWIAGLYFSDQHLHLSDQEYILGLNSTIAQLYGAPPNFVLGQTANINGPLLGDLVYSQTVRYDERQYAAFGEGSYHPLDDLTLTAGARYSFARSSDGGTGAALFNADAPLQFGDNSHDYALTPKFAAVYDLDPDTSIYANASKGFRLGGPNTPTPIFECITDYQALGIKGTPLTYGPDSLWSYELGSKTRQLGGSIVASIAGYYVDWKNVQQHIDLQTCGFDFNANIGNAIVFGSEAEIRGRVMPDLSLGLTGSANRSDITKAQPGSGAAVGDKLLDTPDWSATFDIDYTRSLTPELDGFARAEWVWTGAEHGAFLVDDPNHQNPVYDVVNTTIGIERGNLVVSLFAKNLFDQNKTTQRPSLLSTNEGYTVRPLTVGLQVSTDF